MWKEIKTGGLGAALRLPMGPGQRVQQPPEAGEFSAFLILNFEYPEKDAFFSPYMYNYAEGFLHCLNSKLN
jgi:hypothetical protein